MRPFKYVLEIIVQDEHCREHTQKRFPKLDILKEQYAIERDKYSAYPDYAGPDCVEIKAWSERNEDVGLPKYTRIRNGWKWKEK